MALDRKQFADVERIYDESMPTDKYPCYVELRAGACFVACFFKRCTDGSINVSVNGSSGGHSFHLFAADGQDCTVMARQMVYEIRRMYNTPFTTILATRTDQDVLAQDLFDLFAAEPSYTPHRYFIDKPQFDDMTAARWDEPTPVTPKCSHANKAIQAKVIDLEFVSERAVPKQLEAELTKIKQQQQRVLRAWPVCPHGGTLEVAVKNLGDKKWSVIWHCSACS
jgi:hypothetical protein